MECNASLDSEDESWRSEVIHSGASDSLNVVKDDGSSLLQVGGWASQNAFHKRIDFDLELRRILEAIRKCRSQHDITHWLSGIAWDPSDFENLEAPPSLTAGPTEETLSIRGPDEVDPRPPADPVAHPSMERMPVIPSELPALDLVDAASSQADSTELESSVRPVLLSSEEPDGTVIEFIASSSDTELSASTSQPSSPDPARAEINQVVAEVVQQVTAQWVKEYQQPEGPAGSASGGDREQYTSSGLSQQEQSQQGQVNEQGSQSKGTKRSLEESPSETADQDWSSSPLLQAKRPRLSTRMCGFACPFAKKDPLVYGNCCKFSFTRIKDMKEHCAKRVHYRPYCKRCRTTFAKDEELEQHSELPTPCLLRRDITLEVDEKQRAQILKRSDPRKSEEEQWYHVFKILFPKEPLPPSVYISHELSAELNRAHDYAQQRVPGLILDGLAARGYTAEVLGADFTRALEEATRYGLEIVAADLSESRRQSGAVRLRRESAARRASTTTPEASLEGNLTLSDTLVETSSVAASAAISFEAGVAGAVREGDHLNEEVTRLLTEPVLNEFSEFTEGDDWRA